MRCVLCRFQNMRFHFSYLAYSRLTDKPALPSFVQIKGSLSTWFRPFVTQWLDVICLKAMQRMETAIAIDHFEPVDQYQISKISSSAVDTTGIFKTVSSKSVDDSTKQFRVFYK
jgi:thymidylate kinase